MDLEAAFHTPSAQTVLRGLSVESLFIFYFVVVQKLSGNCYCPSLLWHGTGGTIFHIYPNVRVQEHTHTWTELQLY